MPDRESAPAKLDAKKAFGWVSYDFANTIFSMTISSFAIPLYLNRLTGRDIFTGIGNSVSQLLAAFLGPAAGAVADKTGKCATYVKWSTGACVLFTALLAVNASVPWILCLYILANLTYNVALPFYNALLRLIAPANRRGFLSGFGVAAGFIGAAVAMLILPPIYRRAGYPAGFATTAGLFLLFALPAFLWLKDARGARPTSWVSAIGGVRDSLKTWAKLPGLGSFRNFLIARFLYEEATNTVIVFMSVLAVNYAGLKDSQVPIVFQVLIGMTVAGSIVSAAVVDRVGALRVVFAVLILWIVSMVLALLTHGTAAFLVFGSLAGVALGALSSADRPLLIQLTPPQKTAEYFGFHALSGKLSASFGPLLFGFLADSYGYRAGIASLIVFFVVALAALAFVRVPAGSAAVRAQARD